MLIHELAQYGARESGERTLTAPVRHHTKRAVLDWLAALYPGARMSPGVELVRAHADEVGAGHARLPGFGTTTFPATAAWINGSVSHTVEFDDIFRDGVYHPGCPVISAALAAADTRDCSGLDFMTAIVVGYEISTRLSAAVQPAHYRYFHTTGTVGSIGAAAAVAALYAPGDQSVMQHAIATAATFAAGLQQAFRSDAMTKALHAGHAAAVGIRSGTAAAAGVTGVADILEGETGFAAALGGSLNLSLVTAGLGTDYNITRITQKNHGCCGHTFASIDAALALQQAHGIRADDIASIKIATYQTAINVTGNADPRTAFEGKFSLPYVVAHALRQGSVRLDAFNSERLNDKATRALMKKINVAADDSLTAAFPRHRSARVTIEMNNGKRHEHYAQDRKGDPECPLSDQELNDKYDELVTPVLGSAHAVELKSQVWSLEDWQVRQLSLR
ncbi:2-methylcitrate dehydratase [Advenella sp. S44]|uniref:MmgE/PrpD family protein n=1 Tax=Advenella sp. S44 TaxID=1982755 RepID=UPI000C2A0CBD|nr:MmgE/PrpD family protein [Advenella sp. S44]PJX27903.1 2-methylcitrate dehydratase [Advenella sp. S44]